MDWEFTVLDWISDNLHHDFWTPILKFITSLGDGGILWIALALLLLIPRRTRRCGFAMALSLLLCGLFGNVILKPLVARPRPYDINTAVQLLIPRLPDFSFPSGHTYSSFAGAVTLLCDYRACSGRRNCSLPSVFLCSLPYGHPGRPADGDWFCAAERMVCPQVSLGPPARSFHRRHALIKKKLLFYDPLIPTSPGSATQKTAKIYSSPSFYTRLYQDSYKAFHVA